MYRAVTKWYSIHKNHSFHSSLIDFKDISFFNFPRLATRYEEQIKIQRRGIEGMCIVATGKGQWQDWKLRRGKGNQMGKHVQNKERRV